MHWRPAGRPFLDSVNPDGRNSGSPSSNGGGAGSFRSKFRRRKWSSGRRSIVVPLLLVAVVVLNGLPPSVNAQKDYAAMKRDDQLGFESITQLHHLMDDDQSGSIDLSETTDFVTEEIEIGDDEQERILRRQSAFHVNDDQHITVDDLWQHWLESNERNWTVDETIQWLVESVELPQYIDNFQRNAIDGHALPRMAVQNSTFAMNVLGITNPVHRHKLQLKAMDVVLFGYRVHSSVWKDYLLSGLLASIIALVIFYSKQKKKVLQEKEALEMQMATLHEIENEFKDIQITLQEEKKKQHDIRTEATCEQQEKHEEIQMLRMQLYEAEQRLEQGNTMGAPLALQPLLKKTCDNEMNALTSRIVNGRQRMREAIDVVEKMKRKQATLVNSFKLAVGTSSSTEELDNRIGLIRTEMEQCLKALQDANSRWSQIESLCGFALLNTSLVGSYRSQPMQSMADLLDDTRNLSSAAAMQQVRSNARLNAPSLAGGGSQAHLAYSTSGAMLGHRGASSPGEPPSLLPGGGGGGPVPRPTFTLEHATQLTNDDTRSSSSSMTPQRPSILVSQGQGGSQTGDSMTATGDSQSESSSSGAGGSRAATAAQQPVVTLPPGKPPSEPRLSDATKHQPSPTSSQTGTGGSGGTPTSSNDKSSSLKNLLKRRKN